MLWHTHAYESVYAMKKLLFSIVLGTLGSAALAASVEARSPFKEGGAPGLDASYSSDHSSQTVIREFKRDVRGFEERSVVAEAAQVPGPAADGAPGTGAVSIGVAGPAVPVSDAVSPWDPAAPNVFKFHSGFSNTAVYESNLYDTRLDPVDDLITLPTVWMGVSRGIEGLSERYFEADYGLTYMNYVEDDKLDHLAHTQYTQFDWRGKKLALSLQNTFSPLSPTGTASRRELRTAGGGNAVIATSNSFAFKSAYEIGPKLTFKNTWGHSVVYYPESASGNNREIERQSRQVHSLAPRFEYQVTAKTTVFTGYQFETGDYFKGGVLAFKSHTVLAGLETRPNPKTSWLFQGGYKYKDLNQPGFDDAELFIYNAAWRRQVAAKLLLSLTVAGTLGRGSDTTDPADAVSASGDSGTGTAEMGAALTWAMSERMSLSLTGGIDVESKEGAITLADADNPLVTFSRQREDIGYSWGIGWRWARTAFDEYYVGYKYYNQNSSFKDFEYEDHQVVGSVNLNLDAMGANYGR